MNSQSCQIAGQSQGNAAYPDQPSWWADPARLFLVLGLLSGLFLVFLLPPHQVADEWRHFCRVWQLADGHLFGRGLGDEIPEAIQQLTWKTEAAFGIPTREPVPWRQALDSLRQMAALRVKAGEASYLSFPTVLYAPVPYAGMVATVAVGRLFTDSSLFLMYLGRLGGLLLAIGLTWGAIRLMPFGRWAFVLIALTPVIAFQRAGLSADGFINSLAMFQVALVLHAAFLTPGRFGTAETIWVAIATAALCLCKQAYLILPLLNWLIPADRFASPAYRRMVRFWIPALGWSLALWWTSAVMAGSYEPMKANCDAQGQLAFVVANPLTFLLIIGRDLITYGWQYLHQMFGTLGHLDLPAAHALILVHGLVLLGVCLMDAEEPAQPKASMRAIGFIVLTASIVLVCGLMYLWWAPVGAKELPGMQGRYFTPFLPLLPLLLVLPQTVNLSVAAILARRRPVLPCLLTVYALAITLEPLYRTVRHHYRF